LDDIGSQRFPVAQFVNFVCHSPPGSSVYHERSEGWTVTDHLLAQAIDALNDLVWSKTVDAQKNLNRPPRVPRPGMKQPSQPAQPAKHKPMTVAEYAERVGIQLSWEAGEGSS
jgi:hypothetical protein